MTAKIVVTDERNSQMGKCKLADAEVHFTDGPFTGLRLIGFGVWKARTTGVRTVTFPTRTYLVNGERRSFALLRPVEFPCAAEDTVRATILRAYAVEMGEV